MTKGDLLRYLEPYTDDIEIHMYDPVSGVREPIMSVSYRSFTAQHAAYIDLCSSDLPPT